MALCGSRHTADTLMGVVFERAGAQSTGLRVRRFAEAQANSRAVIETPNLAGYDEGTETVRCTGVLHIVLPAGPGAPAGRGADFSAPVEFASAPDPEGDGVRYTISGDEGLVADLLRVATAWSRPAEARPAVDASASSDDDQGAVADDAAAVGDTARSKREPEAAPPGIVR